MESAGNEDQYDSEILFNLKQRIDSYEPEPDPTDYSSLRNSLSCKARQWRVFRKQADAVKCASHWSHLGLMPFTYHHCNCYRRYFLVTHPLELLHRNRNRPCSYNYEIIASGRYSKLYLDLEFDRTVPLNQHHNGARMTDTFNKILLHVLSEDLSLKLDFSHILNLDSSTDSKFSRHIIFQFPVPVLLRSNIEAGSIVSKACKIVRGAIREDNAALAIIEKLRISCTELHELQVLNKRGKTSLFVDEGVYTKNRHFRLLGSTKFGRGAPLVVSPENQFKPPFCRAQLNEEYLFLASLITYSGKIEYVVPLVTARSKPKIPPPPPKLTSKTSTSPFPELDDFIHRLIHPCTVSVVLTYKKVNTFVFVTREAGFCSNVGRQHSKSRVIYIVEASRGSYHQKCHHPGCRNFRTKSAVLPRHVQTALGLESDEWDDNITNIFAVTALLEYDTL